LVAQSLLNLIENFPWFFFSTYIHNPPFIPRINSSCTSVLRNGGKPSRSTEGRKKRIKSMQRATCPTPDSPDRTLNLPRAALRKQKQDQKEVLFRTHGNAQKPVLTKT